MNHTYATAGVYTVKVTAVNGNNTQSTTLSVTVTNAKPTVNAGVNQSVQVNDLVVLDGSGSSDPDGHLPLTFLWEQIDGPAVSLSSKTSASPSFTAPDASAALVFKLTVTDARGLANNGQVIVNVGDVPISGLAVATNSPTTLGADTTLVASAIGSNVTFEWTLGDGSPVKTGAVVKHAYATPGTYTVIVVATNNLGSATKTATLQIVNPIPVISAVVIDPPPTLGRSEYSVVISGSGFVPGAVVHWNDDPRPTTYLSGTELVAVVSGADVGAAAAVAGVNVVNPSPGGGSSAKVVVNVPAPIDPQGEPENPGIASGQEIFLPLVAR